MPTLQLLTEESTKMDTVTPAENKDIRHEAAGNLAFLLSVIRCRESLSEAEEANVRRVISQLNKESQ
jgi:hypothetical protein